MLLKKQSFPKKNEMSKTIEKATDSHEQEVFDLQNCEVFQAV